jgi:hypothetical protein
MPRHVLRSALATSFLIAASPACQGDGGVGARAEARSGGAPRVAADKVTAFPGPGDAHASPRTRITLSGVRVGRLKGLRVKGSETGRHTGRLHALRVGVGAVFTPDRPFAEAERVTVTSPVAVRGAAGRRYAFRVADLVTRERQGPPGTGLLTNRPGSPCPLRASRLRTLDVRTPTAFCLHRGVTFRERSRHLLVSPRAPSRAPSVDHALMILSGRGQLLWYHPRRHVAHDFKTVRYRGRPALASFIRGPGRHFHELRDDRYRLIRRVFAGNGFNTDEHEFAMTERGTAYIGSYAAMRDARTGASAIDYVVQEIDVATGDVLFEWHALDHVPVADSYVPRPSDDVWDYFHGNSIEPPRPGRNTIVISARKTSAVYGIDRTTGRVRWILGGKRDQFGVIGRRDRHFCAQHDARWVGRRDLSLFDNGGWNLPGGCRDHPARVLRLRLDTARRHARLVRRIGSGPSSDSGRGYRPIAVGSARWQRDGDVLVSWGESGRVTEISPRGRVRFKLQLRHWTYRAVGARWVGRPRGRPAVAAERRRNGDVLVWASWNGATEIARWQPLAGEDPAELAPAGASSAFDGLETRMRLPASASFVAVRALGRGGRSLGESEPVAVP